MGKKRGIKTLDMNNPEASTSRSRSRSTRKKGEQKEMNQIEDGTSEKKLRTESNPEVEIINVSSSQMLMGFESAVDKLPPEMVMKIVQYLDTEAILVCRLLNLKWSGIATEICRSRSNIEIHFKCQKQKRTPIIQDTKQKMSLENFKKCLEKSKFFPCTRFRFDSFNWSTLWTTDWTGFIRILDYSENITCLKIKMSDKWDSEEESEKIRSLLLELLPNLREFGVELNSYAPQLRLFSESSMNRDPAPLPNLKVLYLNEANFSRNSGIISDLLGAAPNLEKIEPFSNEFAPIQNFRFLHDQGKLGCLNAAGIEISTDFLSKNEENPAALKELKLKELNLGFYNHENILPEASAILSSLFESNKDILESISMDALGILPQLRLPKLSKVTDLCIKRHLETRILPADLDSGMKFKDVFPALRSLELELRLKTAFPSVDLCCHTLETLQISGDQTNRDSITRIPALFPNLKHLVFKIYKGEVQSIRNFPEVGIAIWTFLTKLQSLELVIDVSSSTNIFPAIDSCITGFSRKDCLRLHELGKIKEEKLAQGQVFQAEMDLDLEAQRKNPSILDLKDLTRLKIRLLRRKKTKKNRSELTLTSISEEFALKRMENLVYEIKKI